MSQHCRLPPLRCSDIFLCSLPTPTVDTQAVCARAPPALHWFAQLRRRFSFQVNSPLKKTYLLYMLASSYYWERITVHSLEYRIASTYTKPSYLVSGAHANLLLVGKFTLAFQAKATKEHSACRHRHHVGLIEHNHAFAMT